MFYEVYLCVTHRCILTYNRQALSDAKRAVYLNPEWEKVSCTGCTLSSLVKIHSCLPVYSPELVYAIFMVKKVKVFSSPMGWSLLGYH